MDQDISATTRALAIPHVVEAICEYLPRSSLCSAAQVDRRFFEYATRCIWGEDAPRVRSLLWHLQRSVTDPLHRQLYASKLRSLIVDCRRRDTYDWAFRRPPLALDHLRHLLLLRYEGGATSAGETGRALLRRHVPPDTIRSLDLSVADAGLLDGVLGERCGRLRELRLDYPLPADEPALARFVAACPRLEVVEALMFRRGRPASLATEPDAAPWSFSIGPEVMVECARLPHLRELMLPFNGEVPSKALGMMDARVSRPFRSLRKMRVVVPWVIRDDGFGSQGSGRDDQIWATLTWFSQIRTLEDVRICVPCDHTVPESALMSLCSLPALKRLGMVNRHKVHQKDGHAILQVSPGQFAAWVSHFPRLERLWLDVRVPPGSYDAALIELGKHCPLLQECQWPAEVNLSALQLESREESLFPNLKHLWFPMTGPAPRDDDFPR
ncbi:hypothetical protein ISF_04113 [Cordyceps fumosorosea ARSEF 2679]|uniref:F-box domain-containing protein n=1 Tax=Cordyceps fumosorosea (strain ARSEF 2679) TaxID=1081104 RepID=A0A167YFW4_CORFA|nr:hypothetical protein ISF_04113 [Cordyceps fumosorosea ARSEF 2679]OAA66275.1 hypothetical protein ISF_04113 [Cordyceps fumosorosea ARSEF 2679]